MFGHFQCDEQMQLVTLDDTDFISFSHQRRYLEYKLEESTLAPATHVA
jgi:hypothetical protein